MMSDGPIAPVKRVYVVDAEDADPMLYRQTQRCLDLVDRLGVGDPDGRSVLDLVEFVQKHREAPSTTAKLRAENARLRRAVELFRRETPSYSNALVRALAAIDKDGE